MKIMVRTVKWFQISRFWENITSQNKLLNVVAVIESSLQEEKAHWLLSTNLNGNLNFTARPRGPCSLGIVKGLVLHQQHRKLSMYGLKFRKTRNVGSASALGFENSVTEETAVSENNEFVT